MSQKSVTPKSSSERIVKDIRRATRKQYSAEEKIRIVLDGLRGEHSIAELCRREGIAESLYYTWSKEFWKPGSGVWRATRRARRPPTKLRACARKPEPSRRSSPSRRWNCACLKNVWPAPFARGLIESAE